ncbi:MAG: galactokinase [Hyphomicrobiales bacterium]|nr:galactokinase [Hyphomicrobiales bacterium]
MGDAFEDLFGVAPECEADAPGRVNMMGDHTDYNDGFVLPMAIPQRTFVEAARAKAMPHRAYSVSLRRMESFAGADLPDFARYVGGCVNVLAERGIALPPLNFRISSNVPVGAGLSSSAALEVAVLRVLDEMFGLGLEPVEIALLAQRAEIMHAGVQCGVMDQMAASLAGPRQMLFIDTRTLAFRHTPLPQGCDILVTHSGVERQLSASAYNERRRECQAAAAMLGAPSLRDVDDIAAVEKLESPWRERARHVVSENARVLSALKASAPEFGQLMNASHASLRDDYAVSAPALDTLVDALQRHPLVHGARLTGAGFGGACVALTQEGAARELTAYVAALGLSGARVLVPEAQAR